MSKALAIEDQVGLGDHFQANRGDMLTLGDRVLMMMPEQVQPRLHRCQDFIHRRLPRIDPSSRTCSSALLQEKGARRFMREKHVDAAQSSAGVNFLVHEVTPPVVLGRTSTCSRAWQLGRGCLIPRRRKGTAQAREGYS